MRLYEIPAWQAVAVLAYLMLPAILFGAVELYFKFIEKWEDR